jgi:hypothetical protein
VKPQYTDAVLCSTISYRNTSDIEQSSNQLDWKIQSPDGVQSGAYMAQDEALQSGQLVPGGTVTGDVFITDPGAKGDYSLINEAVFADAAR